jgi:hypothetical protein
MAPAKRTSKLLGLAEDLDADEISSNSLLSFAVDNTVPASMVSPVAKRRRGRPAATKITKTARPGTRRDAQPAGSTTNTNIGGALTGKPATKQTRSTKARTRVIARASPSTDILQDTEEPRRATTVGRGRPKAASRDVVDADLYSEQHSRASEVPETQEVHGSPGLYPKEDTEMNDTLSAAEPEKSPSRSPSKRSVGTFEPDAGTAQLRRRVGELSKKCDAWEAKYRDLREVGVKEAERIFDRSRRQMDERAKGEIYARHCFDECLLMPLKPPMD